MIAAEVDRTKERSRWPARRTLAALEIRPATFYRHVRRAAHEEARRRESCAAIAACCRRSALPWPPSPGGTPNCGTGPWPGR